ncbi:hypothetical protein F9C28_07145 [Shimwellia pseudoproteus]|nr:hypothetical protein [Shimwellia pseudoproteus]
MVTGKSAALAPDADIRISRHNNCFFMAGSQTVIYAPWGTSKIRNALPVSGWGTVKLVKPKTG